MGLPPSLFSLPTQCRFCWEKLVLTEVQELNTVDNDVKSKFNQYNAVKTNLAQLQRKQTLVL